MLHHKTFLMDMNHIKKMGINNILKLYRRQNGSILVNTPQSKLGQEFMCLILTMIMAVKVFFLE